jgi:thiol-disulfide isomerase/thioredoxin
VLEKGQVLLRLLSLGTYVQTQHDDHDDVVGRGDIDIVHDQSLLISEARLSLDVGLTRRLSATLLVPVRMISTQIRYLDTAGTEVRLVRDGIHHRNETLVGLADPMLLGGAYAQLGPLRLTGRVGLTIPIGRTEDNPFATPEIAHQHIQMGTGTINPVLAVEAVHARDRWRIGGFAFTQQVVYENGRGYQAGDRYAAGISVRRLFDRATLRGGLEMQAETAERWNGQVQLDDGNRGRIDAMAVLGGTWTMSDRFGLEANLKLPFVTHAVNGQLAMPVILELGVTWTFGKPAGGPRVAVENEHEDEHEDEHDHGEHGHDHDEPKTADTAGLDIADVGAPGEAVDLVPVPGKVTIFDFWATWCEPCKKLDPALVELVREHPGKVALRRIDVVDWDSAATARYLTPGGFDLPHVKIYDATGTEILAKSPSVGQLDALIGELHRVVDAEAAKLQGGD